MLPLISAIALSLATWASANKGCTVCDQSAGVRVQFRDYVSDPEVVRRFTAAYIGQCATGGEVCLGSDCTRPSCTQDPNWCDPAGRRGCMKWQCDLHIWRYCRDKNFNFNRIAQNGGTYDNITVVFADVFFSQCDTYVDCAKHSDCAHWKCPNT